MVGFHSKCYSYCNVYNSIEQMRARLDVFLNRFVSKKLMVFLIGTLFLFLGKLDGEQWINLSTVYIGSQAVIDTVIKLRGNGKQ